MKKIKVIGGAGIGKSLRIINGVEERTGLKLIYTPIKQSDIVEIGGIKYRRKSNHFSDFSAISSNRIRCNEDWVIGQFKNNYRPDVDILTEYQLVLAKKSNLSKRNREWVVAQFKNRYEIVEK